MTIKHALLALLSERPKYGLQLRQEFEAKTGEIWPLNVGQVYTTLQRLERDGLVESEGAERDGRENLFRLTDDGRAELISWLRTPQDPGAPPRDELTIKVLIALSVPGVDVPAIVQVHRRAVVEAMQGFTRLKEAAGPDDVGLALVVDAELFRLEAKVRWLDAAETRIARARVRSGSPSPSASSPNPSRSPAPAAESEESARA